MGGEDVYRSKRGFRLHRVREGHMLVVVVVVVVMMIGSGDSGAKVEGMVPRGLDPTATPQTLSGLSGIF